MARRVIDQGEIEQNREDLLAIATRDFDAPRLLHPRFIGVGAAPLMGACLTDVMYGRTALWQWANFSAWLIAAGLVLALIAALVLALDFAIGRAGRLRWPPFLLVAAAALLSLLNVFVHSRDAWTSVIPQGLALSIIVTILLLLAGGFGWQVSTARAAMAGDRA